MITVRVKHTLNIVIALDSVLEHPRASLSKEFHFEEDRAITMVRWSIKARTESELSQFTSFEKRLELRIVLIEF